MKKTAGKKRKPKRKAAKWVVYLLRCRDGSLYCGMTNELETRLKKHQDGRGAKYTRSRLPVKLAFVVNVKSRSAALKREYAIKQLNKAGKELLVKTKTRKDKSA